ncbi:dehydrogenase [Acetobacter nitrogenifigens DSM 23921 = NBRC 105050]|uniref:3-oxoacyl-ACP reductase n=1 Tax=Acetobacter nitrogenifigens DSM 23921 = NBRC 105050 TaxID=1120919 RepID=A0A511X5L0_9PROT|nr:SDR family oxidoreductase [Acetobacter nitrogenifigens]GBQ98233.1 dehydrogenase [Acetobacter nitrogenifigens DSM 23921 = NBRC 105050]GEN58205.1 3-oxoacyl-ACP reductase [Acetobacter nitrogenifigens DSM 23921 = NBRC 105050]
MDLGIAGRKAIVCAASKGLGRGVAEKLAAAGVHLTLNARGAEALEATAADLSERYAVSIKTVAADVTTEQGRAQLLETEPAADILINNAGGPPPGMWSDWSEEDWLSAVGANMLTPIMLIKAVLPGMIERGWGRVVNITSSSVKAPIGNLGLSTGARCGLTGYVAGTARQVAKHGVVINNLLPGMHETDRLSGRIESDARNRGVSYEQARADLAASIPTGHLGRAQDFGAVGAFLCSEHVGFMVGQNVLLDGGMINATF